MKQESAHIFCSLQDIQEQTHLRLNNLEVPNLDSRCREVRNLELDADGSLGLSAASNTTHASAEPSHHSTSLLVVASHAGQTELGAHEELFAATELLDLPHDGACFGCVVHRADVGAEFGRVGVFGDGDGDLDVVGC